MKGRGKVSERPRTGSGALDRPDHQPIEDLDPPPAVADRSRGAIDSELAVPAIIVSALVTCCCQSDGRVAVQERSLGKRRSGHA